MRDRSEERRGQLMDGDWNLREGQGTKEKGTVNRREGHKVQEGRGLEHGQKGTRFRREGDWNMDRRAQGSGGKGTGTWTGGEREQERRGLEHGRKGTRFRKEGDWNMDRRAQGTGGKGTGTSTEGEREQERRGLLTRETGTGNMEGRWKGTGEKKRKST